MEKILSCVAVIILALCLGLSSVSCSGEKEEKGSIQKMTEQAGKEMADKLVAPMDKAKEVKAQQEEKDKEAAQKMSDK